MVPDGNISDISCAFVPYFLARQRPASSESEFRVATRKPEYEQDQLRKIRENADILSAPSRLDSCWSGIPASSMVTMLPKPNVTLSAVDRMLAEVSAPRKSAQTTDLSAAERMVAEMSLGKPAGTPAPSSTSKALVMGISTSDLAEQLQQVSITVYCRHL